MTRATTTKRRLEVELTADELASDQLSGLAVLPADEEKGGARDNSALTYSEDELVLQRAQASWSELRELEA